MTETDLAANGAPVGATFRLEGLVQGIGVRPAIVRLASALALSGTVANNAVGVDIHVEGRPPDVSSFADRLLQSLPDAARVDAVHQAPSAITGAVGFHLLFAPGMDRPATPVPHDLAVCDACLAEVSDSADRREGYSFTSCTKCGPRYSIIRTMPYERRDTSMQPFALCERCSHEDVTPNDRRFHAQTSACGECGPQLRACDSQGNPQGDDADAIRAASKVIHSGGIVTLKGIGGYQLLCDATSGEAVRRLRNRKRRRSKPLPVMLEEQALVSPPPPELDAFNSPANPIVLVPDDCVPGLAPGVATGLDTVGIMRPTTPLHRQLLQQAQRPLVATSGNVEGEPLAYINAAAHQELSPVADLLLHHDREIVRPIDDSVVRIIAGREVTIRAGRGIAPLPLKLHCDGQLLAIGGHQKVALALSNGEQCVLGPHIGNLDTAPARQRFEEQTRQLMQLYGCRPERIVRDLHPDYFTTRWAAEQGTEQLAVQHHHAHVVAGMLEHGWLDRTVLGVAFDGTGYGTDGTIWGGEFLVATAGRFHRAASLRQFVLPGGEQAVRQPWRIAVALVADACGRDRAAQLFKAKIPEEQLQSTIDVAARGLGAQTSSMGRLFDGAAALILGLTDASFEGEPAMQLEAASDPEADGTYELTIDDSTTMLRIDWRPMIQQILRDREAGIPTGTMATRFHRAVATAVSGIAARFPQSPVVPSGGCFQNRVLSEMLAAMLEGHPQPVGWPGRIPPNDGGLAAGQLAIAAARLADANNSERPR
ncbi:Carbamoyltransferase HypF [Maioricimonas rarisocia]|uniref:Carbamoyltransferase n=1 Tax=Maioricimonas rarisocia TaxID=2528026 RepID=A0A517Z6K2_9PLAN|nr:carbamoyltransferase HypF [Maioricimonas rarisocia]QDU38107.1 Carbamoyltransferase HypF [Maioricimonas rarisocia]